MDAEELQLKEKQLLLQLEEMADQYQLLIDDYLLKLKQMIQFK